MSSQREGIHLRIRHNNARRVLSLVQLWMAVKTCALLVNYEVDRQRGW